jgi:hypothetical protein
MKKQKQEEFYLLIDFLDKLIDNKPEDVTHNELWLAPNLYDILKLKEYRGFNILTDENIPVNQVIIGEWK